MACLAAHVSQTQQWQRQPAPAAKQADVHMVAGVYTMMQLLTYKTLLSQ
jgi:hypothetical protein